jgi:phosphoglycerate dehydrogenase-like enzyme
MTNVLVTVPLGEDFMARLAAVDPRVRVSLAPPELRRWLRGERAEEPELMAKVDHQAREYLEPAEVLVGWLQLPRHVRARAPRLRWVQSLSAGIERADPELYRDLIVTNASGVAAPAMAEYVIAVMLMFAKGFLRMLRNQLAHRWDRRLEAFELGGKTCGIVGMGAIGGEVAQRAKALAMRVLGLRRSTAPRPTDRYADALLTPADLPRLLAESDYVVLAAPLTPETRHLIGAAELHQMKRTAVLINVGRGALVDEEALVAALREGIIRGAALDVFEREPLPPDSPLWDLENVLVTPHFSAGGDRYAERAAELVCDNLRRYLAGEPLRNVVDLERGY